MPIQAVLFDMDGVLVDSEEYWWQSRVAFAQERGLTWTMDDQRKCMGSATIEWGRLMHERLAPEMTVQAIMDDVIARVIARLRARLPVLPGAVEAVRQAAGAYRVALVSGSPTAVIDCVMDLTGLEQSFETIVYGDTIPRGKPAPDIYLEAAARLGVPPAQCVGIEDSANGLKALKAAGMHAIAVPSPGFPLAEPILALADHVLPSLEAFSLELVRGLS
jgi:HAD superfamily hydrolase (TIGR01509 family)